MDDEQLKKQEWDLETGLDTEWRQIDKNTYDVRFGGTCDNPTFFDQEGCVNAHHIWTADVAQDAVRTAYHDWHTQQQNLKLRLNSIRQLISRPVPAEKKKMAGKPSEKVQVIYDEIDQLWREATHEGGGTALTALDVPAIFHVELDTHFSKRAWSDTDVVAKYTLMDPDFGVFEYDGSAEVKRIKCSQANYVEWVADKILAPLIQITKPTELSKIYAGWPETPSSPATVNKLSELYKAFRLWHNNNSQMLVGLKTRLDKIAGFMRKCKTANLWLGFNEKNKSVPLSVQDINRKTLKPLAIKKQTQGLRARLNGGSIKRKNKSKRRKNRKYKKTKKRKPNSRRRTRNKLKR